MRKSLKEMESFCEGEEYALMELLMVAKARGYGAELETLIDEAGYSSELFNARLEAGGTQESASHVTVTTEWSEIRAASLDGQSAVVFTPHAAGIQVDIEGEPPVLSGTDVLELVTELFFVASERND